MDRRKMLGSMALLSLTTALPFKPLLAATTVNYKDSSPDEPMAYKRFPLGEIEITIVSDGYLEMKPVQPSFAPGITPELVVNILKDNFRPLDYVPLGMQIMLIRKENQLIMIDSGIGKSASTAGLLTQALSSAGFKNSDVTAIVLTHAHLDHIGGLVNETGTLAFPNAELHMAQKEFDFWTQDKPDFSKSILKDSPDFLAGFIVNVKKKKTLAIAKPKLQLF
ncbi:MBL fold metallo-hydrolase [Pedobacter sp. NJ-S-72]